MTKYLSFFFLIILLHNSTNAQVNVTTGLTPAQMAQILAGQGVIIMNATMNGTCPTTAFGKFQFNAANPSDIAIDSGIVLTSGSAVNIPNPVTFFSSATFPTGPGDADLDAILLASGSAVTTRDACILEFDFIPAGDTIKFDYVFGSEEYPEYACATVNDVFGFIISGPGLPPGLNNMALIPGTNVPISINSVNMGTGAFGSPGNCTNPPSVPVGSYYVDYLGNGGTQVAYDGFTTVMTAVSGVIPCDTYHLKIGIADGGDAAFDSGVFLKAGSLNSVGIVLTPESTEGGYDEKAHCIRGCKSGFIKFERPAPRVTPLTIKYVIEGSAQNGVDYETIADSIVIPANQTTAELEIKPKLKQYPNPVDSVVIKALSPYACGTSGQLNVIDTAVIYIYDSLFAEIPTQAVTVCPGTEVTIEAITDPTLDFFWTPAALIPDPLPLGLVIHPKPFVTTDFTITVSMPGAPATCPSVKRTYRVNVEPLPQIKFASKDTTICFKDSFDLSVHAEPLGTNYTYLWSPATYLRDNFSANNRFFAPVGNYQLKVQATTPIANCSSTDSMIVRVVPPFKFDYVSPTDTTINYGDRIQLTSESEAIMWLWLPGTYLDDPLAQSPYATPLKDMEYTLVGLNEYGCTDTAMVKINVKYASKSDLPNAFTPNGDGRNDVFRIENIQFDKMTEFRIFNRWGRVVYETQNPLKGWDGTIDGKPAATDVYFYSIRITLPDGTQRHLTGDVTLLR